MNRREWFGSLALGAAALSPSRAQGSGESPEKKSPTEPLDLERKAADTLAGRRPYDPLSYPYFSPDYKLPFTHIGVERQLFLDNFMLEYLEGVKRVLTPPEKAPKPLIEPTGLPWESSFNPIVVAAVGDRERRKLQALVHGVVEWRSVRHWPGAVHCRIERWAYLG